MEEILESLPLNFQESIADYLEAGHISSIKAYVRELITADVALRHIPAPVEDITSTEVVPTMPTEVAA